MNRFVRWAQICAKNIRTKAGLGPYEPLDPRRLATGLGIDVIYPGDIPGLSSEDLAQLLVVDPHSWSGGSLTCPDGATIVVLNPTHSNARNNVTLMEEICHVVLAHRPSEIVVCDGTGIAFRDFKKSQEKQAYSVAAATLLPMEVLQLAIGNRRSAQSIGKEYGTSSDLVEFRLKVCRLWSLYRSYARP